MPKFQVGEKVFFINNGEVVQEELTACVKRELKKDGAYFFSYSYEKVDSYGGVYNANILEKHLFKTKEELIKSL